METSLKPLEKDTTSQVRRVSASKYRGLGDVVHAVAHPIAVVADKLLKTDLQNCPGCAKRRVDLNEKVPFQELS